MITKLNEQILFGAKDKRSDVQSLNPGPSPAAGKGGAQPLTSSQKFFD